MIGTTVGKYRIVEKLGRGGMGTVYKAVDETLDRDVAIKVLNPGLTDDSLLKRFRGEAVTLARLNHPCIATIYELHHHQDDLLMVMEFVRGETFHDLSDRLGPLAPPQAAHLCMQVLDALGHAHRGGVVHRDLKPANLMITDGGAVKVMDFGIARVLGSEHFTHSGYMMGTPAYMAPEQVLGREIDGRADLYSVGVVLYRLLSSRLPFSADTAISMVQMQISEAPTPIVSFRPDLPEWCTAIIDRALAKSPADRFQSAEEFRSALQAAVVPQALGELPTLSTPTPPGLQFDPDATLTHRTPVARAASAAIGASAARTAVGVATATPPPIASTAPLPAATPAATPTATPTPTKIPAPERTTTTVVLGRTHLAALGAVMVVLAIGIGVLAMLALRGRSAESGVPLAQTSAAPTTGATEASPAAVEPASLTPPSASAPSVPPAAVPPAATSSSASTSSSSTATTKPGAAGAPPPVPAPPPAADRGTTAANAAGASSKTGARGTPPSSSIDPAAGRGAKPTTAAAPKDAVPAPPAPVTPPPPAPASSAPVPPPVTFNHVRLLSSEAGKAREREGVLQLANGTVAVLASAGGAPIVTVPNATLTGIFYVRSKQPKWRDANGQEVTSRIDLGPMGFLRGERNWIVLMTGGEPVILRIEDAALRTVLPALQERTGLQIQR